MPTYSFENRTTGETFTTTMTIAERDQYLSDNPDVKQLLCAPQVVDPYNAGRMKTSEDFNSLLKNMKSVHRNSTIQTW